MFAFSNLLFQVGMWKSKRVLLFPKIRLLGSKYHSMFKRSICFQNLHSGYKLLKYGTGGNNLKCYLFKIKANLMGKILDFYLKLNLLNKLQILKPGH